MGEGRGKRAKGRGQRAEGGGQRAEDGEERGVLARSGERDSLRGVLCTDKTKSPEASLLFWGRRVVVLFHPNLVEEEKNESQRPPLVFCPLVFCPHTSCLPSCSPCFFRIIIIFRPYFIKKRKEKFPVVRVF